MKKLDCSSLIALLAFAGVSIMSGCGYSGTPPTPKPKPTAPAITQQPTGASVTVGQAATFSVIATGTDPLTYQWNMNGAVVGSDSNTFTIAQAAAGQTGAQIYVNISNSVGATKSNTVSLTVNAAATAPTISQQPMSDTVTAGQTATFSVTAAGTAPLTYQWFMNGAAAGTNASTLSISQTTTAETDAQIYVKISNSAGSATSNTVVLTVNRLRPPSPRSPSNP